MIWSLIQIEKDVKRINERINEVVKALGTESKAYNDYVSRIKSLIPGKYQRIDKDGLIKLSRSKEFYKTFDQERTQRAFEQLLKVPTMGNIKKEAKKALKEEGKKKPTKADIDDMAKKIDFTEKFIEENQEMFYVEYSQNELNETIHTTGRKKTYSELYKIAEAYKQNKYGEKIDPFEGL